MKNDSSALARVKTDLSKLAAVAPTLMHANGAGRIFELYLMMRIARVLHTSGWQAEPLDYKGNLITTGPFVQRGGNPTGIFPASALSGASSIRVTSPKTGRPYEILNGVQFLGRSNGLHEIDIAVVPSTIADALRGGVSMGYPVGRPPVCLECKDVGKHGSPDEMRSVIARMYDLTILAGHRRHSFGGTLPDGSLFASVAGGKWVSSGTSAHTFREENQRALCLLARRTGISAGAYQMTGLFHVRTYTDVDRGTPSAKDLVSETVHWMDLNL